MEPTAELIQTVKDKAVDGKMSCPMLRKIAEDNGVPYKVAGEAANRAGVKVKDCGLGCF